MGWVPTEDEAVELLKKEKAPAPVIAHCKAVTGLVKELIAGVKVDEEVMIAGALLHDIGRSRTRGPDHGVVGGEILRSDGVDERVALITERHVGAGIPKTEAVKLGFPPKDYLPVTLEEKVVCYADKLLSGSRVTTEAEALYDFRKKLGDGHPAILRMKKLFQEVRLIVGGER